MVAHGLLDEVDVVLLERSEHANGLGERPAAVRIEPEARHRSERLAHRRDLHEILCFVESDLEVEDLESV